MYVRAGPFLGHGTRRRSVPPTARIIGPNDAPLAPNSADATPLRTAPLTTAFVTAFACTHHTNFNDAGPSTRLPAEAANRLKKGHQTVGLQAKIEFTTGRRRKQRWEPYRDRYAASLGNDIGNAAGKGWESFWERYWERRWITNWELSRKQPPHFPPDLRTHLGGVGGSSWTDMCCRVLRFGNGKSR